MHAQVDAREPRSRRRAPSRCRPPRSGWPFRDRRGRARSRTPRARRRRRCGPRGTPAPSAEACGSAGRGRSVAPLAMCTTAQVTAYPATSAPPSRVARRVRIAQPRGQQHGEHGHRKRAEIREDADDVAGDRRVEPVEDGEGVVVDRRELGVPSIDSSQKNVNRPTLASASSVVSSSPSRPGLKRSQTNASGPRTRRHSGLASSRCCTRARSSGSRRSLTAKITASTTTTTPVNAAAPRADVLLDRAQRLPEEVAQEAEQRRPEARTDDVVGQEAPQLHPRRAGQERRQRAHEADEAPDQDRRAAVAVEEAVDLVQALLGDLQLRPVALEEAAPEPAAERVGGARRRRPRTSTRARSAPRSRSGPGRRRRRRSARRSRPARRARRTRPSRGTRGRRRAGRSTCRGASPRPRSAS